MRTFIALMLLATVCFAQTPISEISNLQQKAAAGDAYAQAVLGIYYFMGIYVEKDISEGVKLIMLSAKAGNALGIAWLGVATQSGEGSITQDKKKAQELYKQALAAGLFDMAQNGDKYAQCIYGDMLCCGDGGLEINMEEGHAWITKSAEAGFSLAQFLIGSWHQRGTGVEKSNAEALKWYRKAAEQGMSDADKIIQLLSALPQDESVYEAGEDAIRVKGLYIGMDIRKVPAILKEKLAGKDWGISEANKGDAGPVGYALTEPQNYYVMIGGGMPLGTVIAGPNFQVIRIAFTPMLVNDLFNAADMDATSFAEQFMQAYHIPPMEISDDATSYYHTTEDGVKITIQSDKTLVIEKVASKKERKANFD